MTDPETSHTREGTPQHHRAPCRRDRLAWRWSSAAGHPRDSPLHQRPPGLVSLASWEVDDLDAVVQQARATGFHPSDPATGVLPGTRTATISSPEMAGWTMQLLEYV